jgi:hypothetical protein
MADAAALANDGWRILANVYDTDKISHLYDYGILVAPNGGAGFSTITAVSGNQQRTVFSDYNNTDHGDGKWIEAVLFQEETISASDAGSAWNFTFDVKQGNPIPESSSNAFLKTVNNDLDVTSESILDTTASGTDWATLTLSSEIDNSMVGKVLHFGFSSTATYYTPSGVLYDNINLTSTQAVSIRLQQSVLHFTCVML